LIRKEIYLSFLLSILLFVSIDILSYNHIVLGKEDSKDDNKREGGGREEAEEDEDSKDDNKREGGGREEAEEDEDSKDDNKREGGGREEAEEAEDFEDITIKELFDDDNEDNIKEEKEEEDDVPFRLPFRAVPFP
jgi:hypothetical protein